VNIVRAIPSSAIAKMEHILCMQICDIIANMHKEIQ
jgi:hypothetical protein